LPWECAYGDPRRAQVDCVAMQRLAVPIPIRSAARNRPVPQRRATPLPRGAIVIALRPRILARLPR